MRPPFDLAAVDQATHAMLARGHRLFQTHRYAADDAEQVALLLDWMAPPPDAVILDAGCGIGEVSRLMAAQRPDLSFVLMNLSAAQLALCPVGPQFLHALDDCHATLLPAHKLDAIMYSSALCQMDIPVALAEARRLLKPGGILLINDLVHPAGYQSALEQALAARVLGRDALLQQVVDAGFALERVGQPAYDGQHFNTLAQEAGLADIVAGVEPILIRAVAREEN